MRSKLRYRLGLDLGSSSLGWAIIRLNSTDEPVALVKTGVRIFSDGRKPTDGTSLAVTRRLARQMRRRRDRLLKRKSRLMDALIRHGFMPQDELARRALVSLDPYVLRKRGLDEQLTAFEFGRALFHLNQRRGFKSNRKTDRRDNESGALKQAIKGVREQLAAHDCRTVGEWLALRHSAGEPVRARLRETRVLRADGKTRINREYDLYIDRRMVEDEFDALWSAQAAIAPEVFSEVARAELKDILLFQRPLKPVLPGRCTLIPDEPRAPLALPSTQRFRILQELNNLRIVHQFEERPLSLSERDELAAALERGSLTFTKMRRLLRLPGHSSFNLEDAKRDRLKGNDTARILSAKECFGDRWSRLDLSTQDAIVERLLEEQSEGALIDWLVEHAGVDEHTAEHISSQNLPDGYGSLSKRALSLLLPHLTSAVRPYSDAVSLAAAQGAPFSHHSHISHAQQTGEVLEELPYYGEALERHVGFGTGAQDDPPELRFGKIANPTVHIGLNQLRLVVNALLRKYGHPTEVVIEIARELKQSQQQRKDALARQAENQKQNDRWRDEIRRGLGIEPKAADLRRMRLWYELNPEDIANRRCPYTGEQISLTRLFSEAVEIEHILPFSRTLDDSLNNQTVSLRRANRDKGDRTPFEAFGTNPPGYDYEAILQRAQSMPRDKAKRFAADGLQRWLKDDSDFLARALNDTAYLSRIAKEYLQLICPHNRVRAIPGRLTALLRGKFGLNEILSGSSRKNRDDHRHHAIDAVVVGVTDQGMLQRFACASASAREQQLQRLVESMPMPWPSFREQTRTSIDALLVSHRPDHNHEGQLHNDTAYGLLPDGRVVHRTIENGQRVRKEEALKVIPISTPNTAHRHGLQPDGSPKAYKGYKGDSNFCMEITRDESGKWSGDVISTFDANQIARTEGHARLHHASLGQNGRPVVMRIFINDYLSVVIDGSRRLFRIAKISANGQIFMAEHFEANVDARNRDKDSGFKYVSKMPGSLRSAGGRRVTVSAIGEFSSWVAR